MANPVLVEVTRGSQVESRHRGAFAIVDSHRRLVASAGDIDRPVFPRSAVKILQALPLVENGWADRFGFSDAELALACASHAGEPRHVEAAARMLARLCLTEDMLECGTHWPSSRQAAQQLARDGAQPSQLHNNCSGKHAGFLCMACALAAAPRGYVTRHHPVQRLVEQTLTDVYGSVLGDAATDSCSIPTYAVPLRTLAWAFARLGTGVSFGSDRAAAAARLRAAVADNPEMIAGTGRLDTELAAHFGVRVYTKTGAEGVFCAAMPDRGLGLALKCDDGATRASEFMLVRLLQAAMHWDDADDASFCSELDPVFRNWNGIEVGRLTACDALDVEAS